MGGYACHDTDVLRRAYTKRLSGNDTRLGASPRDPFGELRIPGDEQF
jgi:hypothetical protein